jgi:hypothetical protein
MVGAQRYFRYFPLPFEDPVEHALHHPNRSLPAYQFPT